MNLSYRMGLAVVLLMVVLTHMPMPFNSLSTDDYLIRANIVGEKTLFEKGMILADPDKSVTQGLLQAFHFYSPPAETVQAYKDYGNLPWWAASAPKMNPLRPVSAFTHWLDYRIAPNWLPFQMLHSLVYLLLLGYCTYRLFWKLSPRASVAVLGTLFVVVDYSHFVNFSWVAARNVFIAGAAGTFALEQFIAWRQQNQVRFLLLSLGMLFVSLLSAEAGIGLAGYLFAYLLLVERASLRSTALSLLPYLLLVVTWRLLYSSLGYGASGIGLYLDPVGSPVEFVSSLVSTLPVLLASMITGIDGFIPSLNPSLRIWAALICAAVALLGIYLILPLLRRNALVRFMLMGSILAAVPASALITGSSRSGVFISLGFFWVLSLWLHEMMNLERSRMTRLFAQVVIAVHFVIPSVMSFAVSSTLLPVVRAGDMQYQSVEKALLASNGNRSLVVVNSRATIREFYLPFSWFYEYGLVPNSMNSVAPGMTSFYLTRKGNRAFELHAPVGLPLTIDAKITDLQGGVPAFSEAHYVQMLQGLMTESSFHYRVGDVFQSGDMTVSVLEQMDGSPTRLSISFDSAVDPDNMLWQWYDWESRRYLPMQPLQLGETRFYPGPLDVEKRSLVDICWNCDPEAQ
ncbi:MAG: hypothetical protein D9N11_01640 [Ketobacter sp.]|nr:MAG: hypothetical protein D9N11_01640 [Ketobacter sp.]